jgi:predicted aspartyl protease
VELDFSAVSDERDLVGKIDHLGRPIVRLALVGLEDDIPALVDTGCNLHLVTTQSIARQAHLTKTGIQEGGQLAAGDATFDLYVGTIEWFGKSRNVVIHVPAKETIQYREREDDPKCIIGTRLLRFSDLAISFHKNSVQISRLQTPEDE